MKVYALTDIGLMRALNEDACYVPAEGERFCAVADGMGGHNAGEVASAMAVEVFSRQMRGVENIDAEALRSAVVDANEAVFRKSLENASMSGMGTTFSALAELEDGVAIAHVGDSRVYLIRDGRITQVTTDHTLVESMVRQGMITAREARVHPQRNMITRALGTEPEVDVDLIELERMPDDVFFLCSDGLSGYVEDEDILRILNGEGRWEEKLYELVDMALDAGGSDNITVMVAVFKEDVSR